MGGEEEGKRVVLEELVELQSDLKFTKSDGSIEEVEGGP